MRRVHSVGTAPEIALQKALSSLGLKYSINRSDLAGKPDIVLKSSRVAIFIDGDFWHGSQWKKRRLPSLESQFTKTSSKKYWIHKINRNMRRDCAATDALLSNGWTVLRFWESDIKKNMDECLDHIIDASKNGFHFSPNALLPQRTVAEFFAGIGLVRLGLEKQGWKVSFANDIEGEKHEMYRTHFDDQDDHYVVGDIHKLDPNHIPSVTLATASFPCNDLSVAGSRDGLKGKQSSAFWGFIGAIGGMKNRKPPLIMLENVVGFLSSNGGKDFHQALTALNDLGYSVDAFILNAANHVPQSRQRLFVIGVLESLSEGNTSDEFHLEESDPRPAPLVKFIRNTPEIRWKIRPLPPPPSREISLEDIIEDFPDDAREWWLVDRSRYLLNQMSRRHKEIVNQMVAGSKWTYGTVFRRTRHGRSMAELRTDGVAGCLRTPRGGSGRQILVKAGKGKFFARLVSPREAARLMGADDFKLNVPLNQALFGFGDAVCVPVIEWIAKHYLNPVVSELIRNHPLYLPLPSNANEG